VKRILLVDDDQDILDTLDLILSKEGYEVQTLNTPQTIFSVIHHYTPDLILLDIFMNEFNGLEICKAIKSYYNTQKIPIIIISSHESIHTAKSEFGASDIVIKPFNMEQLVSIINQHLSKSSNEEETVEATG
jgi:DNA-binding response OmpR family regulator